MSKITVKVSAVPKTTSKNNAGNIGYKTKLNNAGKIRVKIAKK